MKIKLLIVFGLCQSPCLKRMSRVHLGTIKTLFVEIGLGIRRSLFGVRRPTARDFVGSVNNRYFHIKP